MVERSEKEKHDLESELKKSANRKFYREDFSGLNLSKSDFRSASIIECDFTGTDLRYANFENANCFGSNFESVDLYRANFKEASLADTLMNPRDAYGLTLTMTCATVHKMRVSERLFVYWLFMATLMKAPTEEWGQKLVTMIGPELLDKLQKGFRERQY